MTPFLQESEERIDLIWSRAHIPDFANDAKEVIKSLLKEKLLLAYETGKKEERERMKEMIKKFESLGWNLDELRALLHT